MRSASLSILVFCTACVAGCIDTPSSVPIGPPHFSGQYFELEHVDRIPKPMYRLAPRYPMDERRAGIGGETQVIFLVDETGRTSQIQVVEATRPAFAVAAIEAVSQWRFAPAMKDGHAVACRMSTPVDFHVVSDPAYPAAATPVPVGPAHFTGEYFEGPDLDKHAIPRFQPQPVYPFALRRAHVTGEARIAFIINAEGVPEQVQAESATHPDFAAAAVAAVSRWRFAPAKRDGNAVSCHMVAPIIFSVSGEHAPETGAYGLPSNHSEREH